MESTSAGPPVIAQQRVAIVGGGWAGLAAAIQATQDGHRVTLLEAARRWGGRACTLNQSVNPSAPPLDNGQHILIGAYTATLGLMQSIGIDVDQMLHATPLSLSFADGSGMSIPPWAAHWSAPLDVLAGILSAKGWTWKDKWQLLRTTQRWQTNGFNCPAHWTVADLSLGLTPRVVAQWLEPLCVSALNTPMAHASARTLLRVLQDALHGPSFGRWRSADLLLPRTDLGALFPVPAIDWLTRHGATLHLGARVAVLSRSDSHWHINGANFDQIILASPHWEASRLVRQGLATGVLTAPTALEWVQQAQHLHHEAIATVYAQVPPYTKWEWPDRSPQLALHSGREAPAQFVFYRGKLGGPQGLLAFVCSASHTEKHLLEQQVQAQAQAQLGCQQLEIVQTVVEKRATFACTPELIRPSHRIAPGLWAAGDYTAGPYPATLEGAVRSGLQAAQALSSTATTQTQETP